MRWAITKRDYWLCNLAVVVIAVLLFAFIPVPLIQVLVVGLLAGSIAGLKMSFGESTGPWKVLDRFLNVNKAHRETAERGTGEARRRRRKTGEAGPDLISVEAKGANTAQTAAGQGDATRGHGTKNHAAAAGRSKKKDTR